MTVSDPPRTLLDALRAFDSKERAMLVRLATGGDEFRLSPAFRTKVKAACGLDVPEDAFAATDFHLDWLYAALWLTSKEARGWDVWYGRGDAPLGEPAALRVTGSQEDIDLLVAWRAGERHHLLLCEAKAFSGWTNAQMVRKTARLTAIFGADGTAFPGVAPHLVLVGPKPSAGLHTTAWPAWALRDGAPPFIALDNPGDRYKVTRCDAAGNATQTAWTHWKAEPRPAFAPPPDPAGPR